MARPLGNVVMVIIYVKGWAPSLSSWCEHVEWQRIQNLVYILMKSLCTCIVLVQGCIGQAYKPLFEGVFI